MRIDLGEVLGRERSLYVHEDGSLLLLDESGGVDLSTADRETLFAVLHQRTVMQGWHK